eukprot:COSAG01_NODE_71744_length_255_cov_0.564103_1_plen_27_part_10
MYPYQYYDTMRNPYSNASTVELGALMM